MAVGGDLEPGTLLAAYRTGLFPMPVEDGRLGWWSPARRGILPPEALHVSASLRRSCRRLRTTIDARFQAVVEACATVPRPHGWITAEVIDGYRRLHELGWAHSVECWDGDRLVGGLYGVAIGGLFAGESMFHTATDASKVALVRLVETLAGGGSAGNVDRVIDVQWSTPHLARLGVLEVTRSDYERRLGRALARAPIRWEEHRTR